LASEADSLSVLYTRLDPWYTVTILRSAFFSWDSSASVILPVVFDFRTGSVVA
jgi:hypothetical protein